MIVAYIGLMGEGKTLSMVADLIEALKKGRKVYSNVPFLYPLKPKFPLPLSNPNFSSNKEQTKFALLPHILDMNLFAKAVRTERNCIFAIDEASLLLSNYFWQSIDQNLIYRLSQSRKIGIDIFYTSQGFSHTLKRLRDLTGVVIKCEKRNVFGHKFFINVQYDPEYLAYSIPKGSPREQSYILGRKILSPSKCKELYKCYNTNYEIIGSIVNIDKNRKSVDIEAN